MKNLEMTLYATVLGEGISYSKSPLIHNYWLKKYNIEGRYVIVDIAPDKLDETIKRLKSDDQWRGTNVTIPYKQKIMDYLDEVDERAQMIGAVNTVYKKEGLLIGTNTDAYGFIENLKAKLDADQFDNAKQKPVLVLGAGGATYAVIYGLLKEGFKNLNITNRTYDKAKKCADHFMKLKSINVIDWDDKDHLDVGMIINTTSLGMINYPPLNIDLEKLDICSIVVDIVYNPLHTELLNQAKRLDMTIVTGIGMLLYQAQPAFNLFFGQYPELDLRVAGSEIERLVLGQ